MINEFITPYAATKRDKDKGGLIYAVAFDPGDGRGCNESVGGEPLLLPLLLWGSGGRFAISIERMWPRPIPRRRNRRVPLRWDAADMEVDSARRGPRVPVHCFGPGPTALGTVCGPGPGAPVGVLR